MLPPTVWFNLLSRTVIYSDSYSVHKQDGHMENVHSQSSDILFCFAKVITCLESKGFGHFMGMYGYIKESYVQSR